MTPVSLLLPFSCASEPPLVPPTPASSSSKSRTRGMFLLPLLLEAILTRTRKKCAPHRFSSLFSSFSSTNADEKM